MAGTTIIWSPGMSLESVEKLIIQEAYRFFRFNKTATASSLGIAVRTLDNKLDQYQTQDEAEKERQDAMERKRLDMLDRARGNPPNNVGIPYSPGVTWPPAGLQKQEPGVSSSTPGIRMESVVNATSKQAMPLSQRPEIQEMLPKHPAQGSKGKGR
jgi:hypothetical protein